MVLALRVLDQKHLQFDRGRRHIEDGEQPAQILDLGFGAFEDDAIGAVFEAGRSAGRCVFAGDRRDVGQSLGGLRDARVKVADLVYQVLRGTRLGPIDKHVLFDGRSRAGELADGVQAFFPDQLVTIAAQDLGEVRTQLFGRACDRQADAAFILDQLIRQAVGRLVDFGEVEAHDIGDRGVIELDALGQGLRSDVDAEEEEEKQESIFHLLR